MINLFVFNSIFVEEEDFSLVVTGVSLLRFFTVIKWWIEKYYKQIFNFTSSIVERLCNLRGFCFCFENHKWKNVCVGLAYIQIEKKWNEMFIYLLSNRDTQTRSFNRIKKKKYFNSMSKTTKSIGKNTIVIPYTFGVRNKSRDLLFLCSTKALCIILLSDVAWSQSFVQPNKIKTEN